MSRSAVTVRIEGLKEVDRALGELKKATARNTLYKVLFAAAAPVDAAWRQRAPVGVYATDTYTAGGRRYKRHPLKKSGGIAKSTKADFNLGYSGALSAGLDKGEAVRAGRASQRENASGRAFAEVVVGPGRHPKAAITEFGSSRQAPHPYFRPAWDATKDQALSIIRDRVGDEIRATAQRVARRAALKAARAGG